MRASERMFYVALIALINFGVVARAADMRTWSDISGRNTFVGSFLSLEGDIVKLRGSNGKTFEISLSKLSRRDQEYVKAQRANPFQESIDDDNPFQPSRSPSEVTSPSTSLTPVDRSRLQVVSPQSGLGWNYAPAAVVPELDFTPRNLSFPSRRDFFDKINGMALNLAARKVAFGFTMNRPGTSPTTRMFIGDLKTGEVISSVPVEGEWTPLALCDDGQQIVVRSNGFSPEKKTQLSIWRIDDSRVDVTKSWTPYEGNGPFVNEVSWAAIAGNGELITCSKKGIIMGWDLEATQPTFQLVAGNDSQPALSPDRKFLAFCSNERISLLDIAARAIVGVAETPRKLHFSSMAFSPSGQRIACGSQDAVLVWNAATGDLERDVSLRHIPVAGAVAFPDEQYVLLGNKYLVDVENEIQVWEYRSTEVARADRGLTLLAGASPGQPGGVFAVRLPHPEARQLAEKIVSNPEIVAYRAGDPVRLDVSRIDPAEQDRVRDALIKKLGELGSNVSEDAGVTIVAFVEGPKSRKVSYHTLMLRQRVGDYQAKEYLMKLEMQVGGERAWGSSTSTIPSSIQLKSGENIEGKLRDAEQPNYRFYETVKLPKLVVKPGAGLSSDRPTLAQSFIDH